MGGGGKASPAPTSNELHIVFMSHYTAKKTTILYNGAE